MVSTPLEIVPAFLARSATELQSGLKRVFRFARRVQIDVVDGQFAANRSVGPAGVRFPRGMKADVHLMVKNPADYVTQCLQPEVERIIAQVEEVADQENFCRLVTGAGKKPGLALDVETPLAALGSSVLACVDYVLVLAVRAGFAGQVFMPDVLPKVRDLKIQRQSGGYSFRIGVDGGVRPENIGLIAREGADEVAVGSYLVRSSAPIKSWRRLQKAVCE